MAISYAEQVLQNNLSPFLRAIETYGNTRARELEVRDQRAREDLLDVRKREQMLNDEQRRRQNAIDDENKSYRRGLERDAARYGIDPNGKADGPLKAEVEEAARKQKLEDDRKAAEQRADLDRANQVKTAKATSRNQLEIEFAKLGGKGDPATKTDAELWNEIETLKIQNAAKKAEQERGVAVAAVPKDIQEQFNQLASDKAALMRKLALEVSTGANAGAVAKDEVEFIGRNTVANFATRYQEMYAGLRQSPLGEAALQKLSQGEDPNKIAEIKQLPQDVQAALLESGAMAGSQWMQMLQKTGRYQNDADRNNLYANKFATSMQIEQINKAQEALVAGHPGLKYFPTIDTKVLHEGIQQGSGIPVPVKDGSSQSAVKTPSSAALPFTLPPAKGGLMHPDTGDELDAKIDSALQSGSASPASILFPERVNDGSVMGRAMGSVIGNGGGNEFSGHPLPTPPSMYPADVAGALSANRGSIGQFLNPISSPVGIGTLARGVYGAMNSIPESISSVAPFFPGGSSSLETARRIGEIIRARNQQK